MCAGLVVMSLIRPESAAAAAAAQVSQVRELRYVLNRRPAGPLTKEN